MGVLDDLHRARQAYERREWVAAYQALSDLDPTDLRGDDFSALAMSAYLLGRRNDCVQALQRAHQAQVAQGDVPAAVRSAFWLAMVLITGGEPAVGGGWVARAQRALDELDHDTVEHGYVLVHRMFAHMGAGEHAEALEAATRIADYGRRYHDPDLLAQGLNAQGRLLSAGGQVSEGLRLLDEAMTGVVAGEVSPVIAGQVYCSMIEGCMWVCDFARVAQWTHALTSWCDAQPGLVAFTGQCAVHRGQLMRLHGAYADALDELALAAERYSRAGGDPAVGLALRERGDVLCLLGRWSDAEAAYAEAAGHGTDAQPGQALLRFLRGRTDVAVAAVRRVVAEAGAPVERIRTLPVAVEILLGAAELDEASALADELAAIATSFGCTAVHASAGCAAAQVALARGEGELALARARDALGRWQELSAAYEVARCRVLVGRALRLLRDEESAVAELTAARRVFSTLGADPAVRGVDELLGTTAPGGLSPREVEVLRLVAAGRSNPEIAAALVLSEKTVARHLSNIFAKLDVGSRTAAAAFAYEHRLV